MTIRLCLPNNAYFSHVVLLHLTFLLSILFLDIDNEGVIDPDNDPPQEMGDESVEVLYVYTHRLILS